MLKVVIAGGLALALLGGLCVTQPSLTVFILLSTVFGACVGSFLNVVVWRLPQMLERDWAAAARELLNIPEKNPQTERFDLSFPRSHCPHCKHPLGVLQLIPVLSWLALRGRCQHCQGPVSERYPLVEMLCATLTGVTVGVLGLHWATLTVVAVVWAGIALALIDADTFLLPDEITQPLLWGVLLASGLGVGTLPLDAALFGAAWGYGTSAVLAWVAAKAFGREALGQGDWKLLAIAGALLGGFGLPWIWLMASLSALFWAGYTQLKGRAHSEGMMSEVPFGPHLVVALVTLMLSKSWLVPFLSHFGIRSF